MEKKLIENMRGKVTYWIHRNSSNQTIVFTHGVLADHTLFTRQIAYFSKNFNVITWDMPLHGESRQYKSFSFEHAAEDLKQILDIEGTEQVIMVGQGAGGYVIQSFIKKYTKMVDVAIFVDAVPYGKQYNKVSNLMLNKYYKVLAKLYPYDHYCREISKAATYTKEARESFYDCLIRLGKDAMLKAANQVYNQIPKNEEVDIPCPVLILVGEFDKVGMIRRYNERWAKEKGYSLQVIPKAGNHANADNYTYFNQTTGGFLKKLRGDA